MNSWSAPQILLISLGLCLSCAIFAPTVISAKGNAENLARSPNCTAVQCPSDMICVQKRIKCGISCRTRSAPYCEINSKSPKDFEEPFTCESVQCPETHVCVMKDKCEKGPCPLRPSCEPQMVHDEGCWLI